MDTCDDDSLGYDMIILSDVGIDLFFTKKTIQREGAEFEMRDFSSKTPSRKEIQAVMRQATEPKVTTEATSKLIKILDSTYEKADLQEVVLQAKYINKEQQDQ